MNRSYNRALTIAGSDSGGGAGIQADVKTFSALGCYGMTVITALTAQNTRGVDGIHPVPPDFVAMQMDAVLSDIGADAVKIGMLFSSELIKVVAEKLIQYSAKNIVLDPVMVATSGDKLLRDDAIEAIKEHLMPIAEIVTPNLSEAGVILDRKIDSVEELRQGARDIAMHGSTGVLIKGGHLADAELCSDVLYLSKENRFLVMEELRIETENTHGTGCTLSSAVAAHLARGMNLEESVKRAKAYVTCAIESGALYELGTGHGPVNHFYGIWEECKERD